mmetsp:Transcript_11695/g.31505  ORF Transcript_11695/g.31505 Transcript_11695/m.31505 type:complete len:428 (+) Transcript_11695:59-1342(+)
MCSRRECVCALCSLLSISLVLGLIHSHPARQCSSGASYSIGTGDGVATRLGKVPWDLHAVEVNRLITTVYTKHAAAWQGIIDTGANATHTDAWPTWFAFAPYASREVGHGILLFTSVQEFEVIDAARLAITAFNFGTLVDPSCGWMHICWRAMLTFSHRAIESIALAPLSFTRTAKRLLEHGNRHICEHIAGASEQYFEWRQRIAGRSEAVQPSTVLAEFQLKPLNFEADGVPASVTKTNSSLATRIYTAATTDLRNANQDQRPMLASHRCVDILVAAFACWESAGLIFSREGASERHKRWMEFGNNMVVYCEQAEAAAPAFRPRGAAPQTRKSVHDKEPVLPALPGEVSRHDITALLTPFVRLPFRQGVVWTMDSYAKSVLPNAVLNWGRFGDRYLPILNSLRLAYRTGPSALWPLPHPDPTIKQQ